MKCHLHDKNIIRVTYMTLLTLLLLTPRYIHQWNTSVTILWFKWHLGFEKGKQALKQLSKHDNHQNITLIKTALIINTYIRKKDKRHCFSVHMSTLLLISIHDGNVIGAQHGHIEERGARWATGIIQYIQTRNTGGIEAERERTLHKHISPSQLKHPLFHWCLSDSSLTSHLFLLHTEGKNDHLWGTTLESH